MSGATRFVIGTPMVLHFEARPKNDDGTDGPLTNADSFSAVIQPPNAPSYTLVATDVSSDPLYHSGTGLYRLDLTGSAVGPWVVRTVSTGIPAAVKETTFFVDASQIVR